MYTIYIHPSECKPTDSEKMGLNLIIKRTKKIGEGNIDVQLMGYSNEQGPIRLPLRKAKELYGQYPSKFNILQDNKAK